MLNRLTENFTIGATQNDANANTEARASAIALPVPLYRGATNHYYCMLQTFFFLICDKDNHTVHTARQIPTGTSNSRCLCWRVRFGG